MQIFRMGDTTIAGPALARFRDETFLSWPAGGGLGGGPPNLRINVRHGLFGQPGGPPAWKKVVLDDTSRETVALAQFNGRLYLAWTALDGVGRLVMKSSTDGESFSGPMISNDTCLGGPALAGHRGTLVRAWAGGGGLGGGAPNGKINLAWSSDGTNWPGQNRIVLEHTAASGPTMTNYRDQAGDEWFYLAWTDHEQHMFATMTLNGRFNELASRVVRIEQDGRTVHSLASPNLAITGNNYVVLTWPDAGGGHNINAMNANIANVRFGALRTWSNESALSKVAGIGDFASLVYAYQGTDGVGGLYVGTRATAEA